MAQNKRTKRLTRLMKQADALLSKDVRDLTKIAYENKCPFCKERPIQCCFHFVRRQRKAVRWDTKNVIGACHGCNYKEYRNPDPYRAWYIRAFGVQQYLALVDKSLVVIEDDSLTGYLEGFIKGYGEEPAQ